MRLVRAAHLALIFPAFLLLTCAGRESGLFFLDASRQRQALIVKNDGRYLLKRPVLIEKETDAFYLRYQGKPAGREVRVFSQDERVMGQRSLPATENELSLLVALLPGSRIAGFAIAPAGSEGLQVLGAGLTKNFTGFDQDGEGLRIGAGVRRLAIGPSSVEVILSSEAFSETGPSPGWRIRLDLSSFEPVDLAEFRRSEASAGEDYDGPSFSLGLRARVLLRMASEEREINLVQESLPGEQQIFLYPGIIGFTPQRLVIRPGSGNLLRVHRLEVTPAVYEGAGEGMQPPPSSAAPSLIPLPADPGTILLYDRKSWRQPGYELFAWSRFPEILIFDTADYALQDRLFKRLAFYVEKRGYRGKLVAEEQVQSLHGFNAHDYRAEDLARFFQEAAEQSFPLMVEEELLKSVLIRNGVLRQAGSLQPGRGGVLSISRSSSDTLRRQLLTHESFHGVFFALPEYREASSAAWQALAEEEREFWRMFLSWGGYDIEDEYLMVNEFQAYLFQQERSGLHYYFRELIPARLSRSFPDRAGWIREFLQKYPDSFERAFDRLEQALRREARLEAGRVVELALEE